MGGFLLLIGGALMTPATPELHVDEAELVTNEQGEAAITGQTNPEAQLTINGVEVSLADETFSYTVQLEDEEEQEFTLKPQWWKHQRRSRHRQTFLAHF